MYKILKDTLSNKEYGVLRIADNAMVPFAPDNTDYQQYLKWVEAGNTPLPADEGAA
jgi:hypothetical protein